MNRGTAHANRTGLIVLGLLLCAAGAAALARGLGVLGTKAAQQPLLTDDLAVFARENAWFWPVVALTGLLVAIIGLAWLLAQFRLNRLRRLRLESSASGVSDIGGRTVCDALAEQVMRHRGVEKAGAVLRGPVEAPKLDMQVSTSNAGEWRKLVTSLHDTDIPDVRRALGLDRLPAVVRLGFTRSRRGRELI
jgi:hypothetical protein